MGSCSTKDGPAAVDELRRPGVPQQAPELHDAASEAAATKAPTKRVMAKFYDPASEKLETLSTEELMRLLDESDAKLKDTRKKYNEASSAARGEKTAKEFHKLSSAEQGRIRQAFDQFDTDRSGKIDLKELRALARKLGHDMKESEAEETMKELDKNKDGTVDFDEFVGWWRASGSHGLLGRVKLRLLDRILNKDAQDVRKKVELDAVRDTAKPLSLNYSMNIGPKKESFGTTVDVILKPSSDPEFESTVLPEPLQMRTKDFQLEQLGTVVFTLRQGAPKQKIDRMLLKMEKYIKKLHEKQEDEDLKLHLKLRSTSDAIELDWFAYLGNDTPFTEFKKAFETRLGRLPQGADFFQAFAVRVGLDKAVGDVISLDNEVPVPDLFNSGVVRVHGRGSALLPDVFTGFNMSEVETPLILFAIAMRTFSAASVSTSIRSFSDVLFDTARLVVQLCKDDVKEFLEVEEGVDIDDEALAEKLKNKWYAGAGPVGIPVAAAMALFLQSLPEGEFPDALDQVAEVVEGISSIKTTGRLFSAEINTKGLHILRNFPYQGGADRKKKIKAAMVLAAKFMGDEDEVEDSDSD
eukprot:Hpha_TRINITY_DN16268_c0_g1::TRINITY_DN16268_c0_g1_i1::g.11899::m.11899